MRKLETLWHRWTTNTLPKKRPSQAGIPRKRAPKPEGQKPYPSGFLWLCHNNWQVNNAGALLLNNLTTPAFQEFITAVPQAARLLRPVLKQLHIDPPAFMALPPRPRKPRPKKPKPEKRQKPQRIRGGWVARNAVVDIAGYPKFIVKPRLDTS
jgi:hypothetical protein